MDLLWPEFLLLLGIVPLMIGAYIWILRRRKPIAVRYSSLSLVREAVQQQSWLKRHLPFIFFLLALVGLIIALARPVAVVTVPTGRSTIIMAIDVSRSMCSTDISPNRLEAAKNAALSFIQSQPANTQIGIVAFAGFAEMIQPPTNDQELLESAVLSLVTGRRTAIGSAILKSIDAIAELDKNVAPSTLGSAQGNAPTPVAKGAYAPAIIVILTDGVSNTGPLPLDAARQALDRGIRVYTIGFGTANPGDGLPSCGSPSQSPDPFGAQRFGGGGIGGGFRRGIDEAALKDVAYLTGGEYYSAESADELKRVYQNLPTNLIAKHETMEISVAFTAFGALMTALAVIFSLLWRPLS